MLLYTQQLGHIVHDNIGDRRTSGQKWKTVLSPYLLILVIGLLYKSVQTDNDIKGINMFNREIKKYCFRRRCNFHAGWISKKNLTLINKLNDFSKVSGLKLNSKKSIILRSGSLKHSSEKFGTKNKFMWTSDNASTLGIVFFK